MTTTVRVFHNNNPRDGMVFGFQPAPYQAGTTTQPAHTVTEVLSYTARPADPEPVEYAFTLCNVDHDPDADPPDPRTIAYRDRANRSLSIGDVVAVHDGHDGHDDVHGRERGTRWYACASAGFHTLDQAPTIRNTARPGTTPIEAPLVEYEITFASPDELTHEPWTLQAYTRSQLTHLLWQRLTQHLGAQRLRIRWASHHLGFALATTGATAGAGVAVFTAAPAPDTAAIIRMTPTGGRSSAARGHRGPI